MTPLETCRYAGHFPELEGTAFAMPRSAGMPVRADPPAPPPLPPGDGRRDRTRTCHGDLKDVQYGLLVVLERVSESQHGSRWTVKCRGCRRHFVFNASDLVHGLRKTCGQLACRKILKAEVP